MELDPYYRVKITLSLNKKLQLPMDTAALIQTNGLVGNKYIALVPGGDDAFLKDEGMISYTQDVLLIDDLLARLVDFMRAKKGIANEIADGVQKGVEI